MKYINALLVIILILCSIITAQQKTIIEEKEVSISTFGVIDVNNIYLPLNNAGLIADVNLGSGVSSGALYDNIMFLFAGGFCISGLSDTTMWSSGVLYSPLLLHYQPGAFGSDPADENNQLFFIKNSDLDFGQSWLEWDIAVSMGANFYDGDGNGVYNPVDLNGNGNWDNDEDRPDLLADISAWCIYNDSLVAGSTFFNSSPQGIEIRQTVFAYRDTITQYKDIIFIRYNISNTGLVTERFDSVYFAPIFDPDIGNHEDDLIGVDSLDNSCYVYNNGEDNTYGSNPPSFLIKQLQGPPVFLPGETFTDNNSDGEFTSGIDTPIDSAIFKRGKYLGVKHIPGAKNLIPTAFTQFFMSHPTHGFPQTKKQLRNLGSEKDL